MIVENSDKKMGHYAKIAATTITAAVTEVKLPQPFPWYDHRPNVGWWS